MKTIRDNIFGILLYILIGVSICLMPRACMMEESAESRKRHAEMRIEIERALMTNEMFMKELDKAETTDELLRVLGIEER
jgi:hypothetical protein